MQSKNAYPRPRCLIEVSVIVECDDAPPSCSACWALGSVSRCGHCLTDHAADYGGCFYFGHGKHLEARGERFGLTWKVWVDESVLEGTAPISVALFDNPASFAKLSSAGRYRCGLAPAD